MPTFITSAVEGLVDEALARRLIMEVGAEVGPIHGKGGKHALLSKIVGYNNAARFAPWLVLVDLDDDADCAPPFVEEWLPEPAAYMSFRVVVREAEAWLLADRERFARFLRIRQAELPSDPESVADPKQLVVTLARRSQSRAVRDDLVPRPGSGISEGPLYASRIIEFILNSWRPGVAAERADSLRRCLDRLRARVQSNF